jgi:hypothetical protein
VVRERGDFPLRHHAGAHQGDERGDETNSESMHVSPPEKVRCIVPESRVSIN